MGNSLKTVADGLRAIADQVPVKGIETVFVDDHERVVCRVNPETFIELARVRTVTVEIGEYGCEPWIHCDEYSLHMSCGIEKLFRLGLFVASTEFFNIEVKDAPQLEFGDDESF